MYTRYVNQISIEKKTHAKDRRTLLTSYVENCVFQCLDMTGIVYYISEDFKNTGQKMVVKVLHAQYVQNTFSLVNAWGVHSVTCVEEVLKVSVREVCKAATALQHT